MKYKPGDVISDRDDHHKIVRYEGEYIIGINMSSNGSWTLQPDSIGRSYLLSYRRIRTRKPRRPVEKHSRFKLL